VTSSQLPGACSKVWDIARANAIPALIVRRPPPDTSKANGVRTTGLGVGPKAPTRGAMASANTEMRRIVEVLSDWLIK